MEAVITTFNIHQLNKVVRFLILIVLSCSAYSLLAQSVNEADAVKSAALQYLQAWEQGDPGLMEQVIHPQMGKKIVFSTGQGGGAMAYLSAQELIAQVRKKRSRFVDVNDLVQDIQVLDIYRHTAAVRTETQFWVDYLHLAKISGQWKIVNILWELRQEGL